MVTKRVVVDIVRSCIHQESLASSHISDDQPLPDEDNAYSLISYYIHQFTGKFCFKTDIRVLEEFEDK
jgi:hypothetical protein